MRRLTGDGPPLARRRSTRPAATGIALVVAVMVLVAAGVVIARRRGAAPNGPGPVAGSVPAPLGDPVLPPYGVTRAPDAMRGCYPPGDPGAVVLDTRATVPGITVVTIALDRDRTTLAYVEARQNRAGRVACLGRVSRETERWVGYVRRLDPALGMIDGVLDDATGTPRSYPDPRAASVAVEEAARASWSAPNAAIGR